MSDIIRLLPDSVANQIAAGEVIQRPASVIKELVENAVDAGAHHIKIIIKDAGRTLIQVVDDGCGMSDTDARMAFERHATSKIKDATDLYSLHTMGFRGEALPSIAAISQIELKTCRQGASIGTKLKINASHVESQEPEAMMPGTNMMVKNLFFNIPVRRKFLKKDSVELSNILREFERMAIVNPSIELTIMHNDSTLHHLLPATPKQRIVDLFGRQLERQLIPIETETSLVKISGYIGLPESAKRRGALQYLTVNGRCMRHPYFHKAITMCYDQLISSDTQPSYFVNFSVDPDTIDVNIHPTKNEIKFENEQPIWQILTAAVRESLNKFNAVPAIDFNQDDAPVIPAFNPHRNIGAPTTAVDTAYNPFTASKPHSSGAGYSPTSRTNVLTDWEKLYQGFNNPTQDEVSLNAEPKDDQLRIPSLDVEPATASTIQIGNKYIISPWRDGLMVIDQHRAHTLILYNEYIERLSHQSLESQAVMFGEEVELSPSQYATLSAILKDVEEAGFRIEQSDNNRCLINGVPAMLAHINPTEALINMITTIEESGEDVSLDIRSRIALSMARSAAIGYGKSLSSGEREKLMASLMSQANPRYTPDGLKTMETISIDDISTLF